MKLIKYIAFIFLLFPFVVMPQSVKNDGNEYNLKALFIFNFIKYVDWPPSSANSHFNITVLGPSEIIDNLQKIAEQRKINDQKINVRESDDIDGINCQVLFISRNMSDKLPECVSTLSGKGVLIITEGKNLASKGAAINFITVDNKMKFEINQAALKSAGLRISSQLMDLAIVVK